MHTAHLLRAQLQEPPPARCRESNLVLAHIIIFAQWNGQKKDELKHLARWRSRGAVFAVAAAAASANNNNEDDDQGRNDISLLHGQMSLRGAAPLGARVQVH